MKQNAETHLQLKVIQDARSVLDDIASQIAGKESKKEMLKETATSTTLEAPTPSTTTDPIAAEITYEDFSKIDPEYTSKSNIYMHALANS